MSPETEKWVDRKSVITSNMEDYLKAIYELADEGDAKEVRITDIGKRLGVTRPSVVGMIKHLVEHQLVIHHYYGGVELTGMGREVAQDMADRHRVVRRFMEEVLGLDAEIAEDDACRMEHALSPETIDRFMALEEFREEKGDKSGLGGEAFRKFLRERRIRKKSKE